MGSETQKPGVLIFLLFLFYLSYLLLGALIVSTIEKPHENRLRKEMQNLRLQFLNQSTCVNASSLEKLLLKVLDANKYGVSILKNASAKTNWDFASSFFFASTLVTTVGYGHTTPLSDSGKCFCILFALFGVPFTMLVLTATIQRLMVFVTAQPISFFQQRYGYARRNITRIHFVILLLVTIVAFLLLPALIFSTIEASWTYLDAFYFCFISLCTIGLGDYVPGEQYGQKLRPLYKVSVTVYLLLGLLVLLLVLQTFHKAADLHGITSIFQLPPSDKEDQEGILDTSSSQHSPGTKEKDDKTAHEKLYPNKQSSYSSINR
ncbi:potassium channel subfamily K member 6 [Latimeria chalumnae]|uniref:Potassium channel subfamily K member n=1 Tax=Latimeria chalumnae TaxID=7897 RepID=H3BAU4_LATCH|nr:PREDICTED: potassium channel subfamily K member 6 [Latimeria chalumnae]|eukprot:XP_005991673.1 PREDICTED: potassium channel subfamily K member 6 [Latimeria chalumnae]